MTYWYCKIHLLASRATTVNVSVEDEGAKLLACETALSMLEAALLRSRHSSHPSDDANKELQKIISKQTFK